MRYEVFYNQPAYFSRILTKIQRYLTELKRQTNDRFEKDVLTYVINRLTEFKLQAYFSHFLEQAKIVAKIDNVIVNDIDKVIRIDNEIKAIFELKTRRMPQNGFIKVNKAEWLTLRMLSDELDVPVFYLVKLPGVTSSVYKLVKLNFWRTEVKQDGRWHLQDYYVKIPLAEGLTLNDAGLIDALADIIG